jgi:glycerophosphoryl diester phosphodiesterase
LRLLNAPAWLTARPIAHRGLHDAARGVVENTLAAAAAAIAGNFSIECDVQLSRDEKVFVFHDDTLDRLTDATGPLIGKSAAEIRRASLLYARSLESRPSLDGPCGEKVGEGRMRGGADPFGNASPAPLPVPVSIPTFAEFLAFVAGRVPIVCELKSRFDGDWRIGDRVAALASSYEGPLALKSFDPDVVTYLRLKHPQLGPVGRPCPIGIVAEGNYDDPSWDFLSPHQKRACETFDHRARSEPDFLSWNVDHLPHRTPFFEKEFFGLPIMAWTVRSAAQREAARKWADQIVFEGDGRP